MNKFFNSCRRCLSPWVVGLIIVGVIGLLIFIPKVGAVSLIAILPLVGCTVMCGAMAFFMKGNRKVYELLVSTGRPGYKTPTGEFRVWRKVRSQIYKGGSKQRGDYYCLPNVPCSLFFGDGATL